VWLDVRVRSSPAAIAGEVASLLLMIVGIVITSQHAPQVTGPAEAMPIGQQRAPVSAYGGLAHYYAGSTPAGIECRTPRR
jgi:hypothetical protein